MLQTRFKTKEFPRKRKRFIKRVLTIALIVVSILLIATGGAYYLITVELQKPLYVSPLPKERLPKHTKHTTRTSTELQKELKEKGISYTAIDNADDAYVVTLQDGSKVTFSSQKSVKMQIASLQYILSHLTMEGRQFSSLDLRFEKPVIVIK